MRCYVHIFGKQFRAEIEVTRLDATSASAFCRSPNSLLRLAPQIPSSSPLSYNEDEAQCLDTETRHTIEVSLVPRVALPKEERS